MGALAAQRSISDTDASLELPIPEGTLRFGSESELCNYIKSTAEKTPRRKIRVFGRSNRQIDEVAKPAPASCEDNKMGKKRVSGPRPDAQLPAASFDRM